MFEVGKNGNGLPFMTASDRIMECVLLADAPQFFSLETLPPSKLFSWGTQPEHI